MKKITMMTNIGEEKNKFYQLAQKAEDEGKGWEAVENYTKASNLGSIESMMALGRIHENGELGIGRNYQRAIEAYKKAAELGNNEAMYKFGNLCLLINHDYEVGQEWLMKAENEGNLSAKIMIGKYHLFGLMQFERSFELGLEYLEDAANNGSEDAAYYIAESYETCAYPFPLDKDKANEWYRKTKHGKSTSVVCDIHRLNQEETFDDSIRECRQFIINDFENRIRSGDKLSKLGLGHLYIYGYENIIERNFSKGFKLCEEAILEGLNDGFRIIGDGYKMNGDFKEAIKWYTKYVETGDIFAEEYKREIEAIKSKLSEKDC